MLPETSFLGIVFIWTVINYWHFLLNLPVVQAATELARGILPTPRSYLVPNEAHRRRHSHPARPLGPVRGAWDSTAVGNQRSFVSDAYGLLPFFVSCLAMTLGK